jgi:hypothetical protein
MNIKELAEQAGFIVDKDSQKYQKQCIQSTHSLVDEPLAAFALLVAAHEREECAKLCKPKSNWDDPLIAYKIAKSIREMERAYFYAEVDWLINERNNINKLIKAMRARSKT